MAAHLVIPPKTLKQMATAYRAGATIRELVEANPDYTYGVIRGGLIEAGVVLRQRGGTPGSRIYHDPTTHRRACRK